MDIEMSAATFIQAYRPVTNPLRIQAGFPHRYGFRHTKVKIDQYDPHQLWSLVKTQTGMYIVNGLNDHAREILITEKPW